MAKYHGAVGYGVTVETSRGVWQEQIEERVYTGDVLRNYRRLENGEHLNDDLNVSHTISIMADPFAYEHCYAIRYLTWMGVKWKVTGVEVLRPRLNLTVGGVYNGSQT